MIKVQLRPNEPLESALRRFKRQCNYAGVFRLSKKYAHFEKESDRKRREERERIRNIQRAQRRLDNTRVKPRSARKTKARPSRQAAEPVESTEALEPTAVAQG
jgi:small subunit ribosomal protein S21